VILFLQQINEIPVLGCMSLTQTQAFLQY